MEMYQNFINTRTTHLKHFKTFAVLAAVIGTASAVIVELPVIDAVLPAMVAELNTLALIVEFKEFV